MAGEKSLCRILGNLFWIKHSGGCFEMKQVQSGQSICMGIEAVHECQADSADLGLLDNDFQERFSVSGLQQGFGAGKAHAGSQPAVQNNHDRVWQRLFAGVGKRIKLRGIGDFMGFNRPDIFVEYQSFIPGQYFFVIPGKGVYDNGLKPGGFHF